MKLYLDQFLEKEVVDLEFELNPAEADSLLDDPEFSAALPLKFELQAKKSGSTIHVTGLAIASFRYECGRCLADRILELEVEIQIFYLNRDAWKASLGDYDSEEGDELEEEDLDVSFYTGDDIELDDELREAVLLELPNYAVCPDNLKRECDEGLNKLIAEAHLDRDEIEALEEDYVDERWSALKNIKLPSNNDSSKDKKN